MFIDQQLLDLQHAMDEDRKKSPRKRGFSKRPIHRRLKDVFKRKFSAISNLMQPSAKLKETEPPWTKATDRVAQASCSCSNVSTT